MKKMLLAAAAAVAASGVAAVPAITGVVGNPSFSHQIPVPVPEHARLADLDQSPAPSSDSSRGDRHGLPDRIEPGDDHATDHPSGIDRDGSRTSGGPGEPGPGDDGGGGGSGRDSGGRGQDDGGPGGTRGGRR